MNIDNLNTLKYQELVELRTAISARLKNLSGIRLKKKWKRCGKKTCYCSSGPSDGSWGNLHGPYVFAQFVDNETKKPRVLSLGRYCEANDAQVAKKTILAYWPAFYTITPAEAEKMKEEGHWLLYSKTLSRQEFVDFYGLNMEDDKLDRHRMYYATEASHQAFEAAVRALDELREAAGNDWAIKYGIGEVKGQRRLCDLLRGDYYLVPD